MRQNPSSNDQTGISISVPIPAKDDELYSKSATDSILFFLSNRRFEQFSQRELARQVDYSEAAVRRAVETLEKNDLLVCEYEGNQKVVEINRTRLSIPDDPILRIPQEEFHKPVKIAVEQLKQELESIVGIVLHGSIARGEADRRSDIDLWVVVQTDRASNQRAANLVETELEDRRIDGQRYDFHITVEAVESVPAFADDVRQILRTGIPVYTTDNFEKLTSILNHGEFDE